MPRLNNRIKMAAWIREQPIGSMFTMKEFCEVFPDVNKGSIHSFLSSVAGHNRHDSNIQRIELGKYKVLEMASNGNKPEPKPEPETVLVEYFKVIGSTGDGTPVVVSQNGIVYKLVDI